MQPRAPIQYKLQTFEGPLDLLLHLIERAEVEITSIALVELTDQFIAYVAHMEQVRLELSSEFVVMASTLLALKSRELLPKKTLHIADEAADVDGFDGFDAEILVEKLHEYRQVKRLAMQLQQWETEALKHYSREPQDIVIYDSLPPAQTLAHLSLEKLRDVYAHVWQKYIKRHQKLQITDDNISLQQQMTFVLHALQRSGGRISFSQVVAQCSLSLLGRVVTFLAILELTRDHQLTCEQKQPFADVMLMKGPRSEERCNDP